MRSIRTATLGATMLALLLGACTSGGSGASSSAAATEPAASDAASPDASGPSIASTLVLGGPPECPERPFCLLGLEETYGLEFKEFTPLDAGGPLTVQALTGGQIQVGLLFTSDPAIAVDGFGLQQHDQLVGGAILVALLALLTERSFTLLERRVVSPGLRGALDTQPAATPRPVLEMGG